LEAVRRELEIKSWKRGRKINLIGASPEDIQDKGD
jgi:predicted GIY-YIG superfamily endonuclease